MACITPRTTSKGTVYKITVSLGYDKNGHKIQKCTTYQPEATTPKAAEREARRFAAQFEQQVLNGSIYDDADNVTFSEFLDLWDEECLRVRVKSGDMTQRCREDYVKMIRRYGDFILGTKLSKIKSIHINHIVNTLIDDGKSPKTIRSFFNALHACLDYAYRNELIPENPCARCNPLPKVRRDRALHTFSEDEVQRFLTEALTKEYSYTVKGSTRRYTEKGNGEEFKVNDYTELRGIGYQFQVFFNLAVFGGFRRGELIALTWHDVDFEKRTICIEKAVASSKSTGELVKTPKTAAGFRTIKLPEHCFQMLRNWKKEQRELCMMLGSAWQGKRGSDFDDNYIFIRMESGERMNLQTPTAKFRKIITAYNASVPEDKKLPQIRLHDLRHTNASHLIANGTDVETVARRLGHSNPSFTLDVYAHALPEKDDEASDLLEDLFDSEAQ